MAKVDGQIDLVVLRYLKNGLLVLHVNCDKFIANLGSVLSIVHQAELVRCDLLFQLGVFIESDTLRLNFLAPAVFVEALSEKDHVGEDDPIVAKVNAVTHPVQVKRENLIDQHLLSILVREQIVVSVPLGLVSSGRQLVYHGPSMVRGLLRHTLTGGHLLHVVSLLIVALHWHLVLLSITIHSGIFLILLLVLFFLATSFEVRSRVV